MCMLSFRFIGPRVPYLAFLVHIPTGRGVVRCEQHGFRCPFIIYLKEEKKEGKEKREKKKKSGEIKRKKKVTRPDKSYFFPSFFYIRDSKEERKERGKKRRAQL